MVYVCRPNFTWMCACFLIQGDKYEDNLCEERSINMGLIVFMTLHYYVWTFGWLIAIAYVGNFIPLKYLSSDANGLVKVYTDRDTQTKVIWHKNMNGETYTHTQPVNCHRHCDFGKGHTINLRSCPARDSWIILLLKLYERWWILCDCFAALNSVLCTNINFRLRTLTTM